MTFFERLAALAASGRPLAVATVVRTQGSTPQIVGARMAVAGDAEPGRAAGTLGGGCVEADAILAAQDVMAHGGRSLRAYDLSEDLAWNSGLVCGGTMWILAERAADALVADGRPMADRLARAATSGPPILIVTLLVREGRQASFGGRIFVEADGTRLGSFADARLDELASREAVGQLPRGAPRLVAIDDGVDLLIEPVVGRPSLVVAGGGHVSQAIARQAQLLDFDVTILEDRPEFADPARFGGARVVTGEIAPALAALDYGWSSFIVVATRGHKLDADCVLAAVRTPARYIGVLGSRRKTILIADLLREHGVPEDRIAAIRAPIGLDLGGRTPAEIALSVLAEITAVRHAASGAPLSGPVPAVPPRP